MSTHIMYNGETLVMVVGVGTRVLSAAPLFRSESGTSAAPFVTFGSVRHRLLIRRLHLVAAELKSY